MVQACALLVELCTAVGAVLLQDQDRAAAGMHAQRPGPLLAGLGRGWLESEYFLIPADAAIVVYEVSKPKLAEVLWPVLEAKIERAKTDETAPVPPMAGVIIYALQAAQRWRYKSFVLKAAE